MNGFLKRNKSVQFPPGIHPDPGNPAMHQHKHLISDREFEDIVQACRPRYRGEHGIGLPVSLAALLEKGTPKANPMTELSPLQGACRGQVKSPPNTECLNPHRTGSYHLEWGAVNFDTDFNHNGFVIKSQQASYRFIPESLASPSSSFTNVGSHLFHRYSSQHLDTPHLQSPRSLEAFRRLDSSVDTLVSVQKKTLHTLAEIRKIMADHDESVFYNRLKDHDKHEIKARGLSGDNRNNAIESLW